MPNGRSAAGSAPRRQTRLSQQDDGRGDRDREHEDAAKIWRAHGRDYRRMVGDRRLERYPMPSPGRARILPLLLLTSIVGVAIQRAAQPAPDFAAAVDRIARGALAATGVPSASIAVVRDGVLAYTHAYGNARLPEVAATTTMRYSIGSISKQFTSAAILLLQEQRKLSLDDAVGKYVPGLTRGDEVTIRQVLSHTSGYQDYWPQDYVPPFMLTPINAQGILDRWARRPLDFEPGTQWQYSNTNYVIAGLIVEKAAGMPLWQFLNTRVFTPLGITSATNIDERGLPSGDPTGYFRYALGPPRPAPKEGPGLALRRR